jgi:hypothetical protein
MHVGDEDAAKLTGFEVAAEELMLSALTAVKQPDFGTLREA